MKNEQNIYKQNSSRGSVKKRNGLFWVIGIILVIAIVAGVLYNTSQTKETIKIGYIGPLTGNTAILGIEASQAITLAVEQANAAGGINGKQIELFIEDDQYDTSKAVSAYNKLVNQEGVKTIIMSTYGGVFAVSDKAKQDGVLIVDSLDCDSDIANLSENVFCVAKETKDLADVIADFAASKNFTNIGILHSSVDKFMPSVALLFKERLGTSANVQIESYNPGTTDFKTSLLKLKDKEAIVFLGYQEIGTAIKQSRDLGLKQPMLSIPSVATDPAIQEATQGTIDGMYFSFYAPKEDNVNMQEFYSAYESKFGRKPIVYVATDQAYDSANILIKEVLPSSKDTEDKIKAMHNVKEYSGVTGDLTIGSDGRVNGIVIRLYQLKNMTPVYISG